MVEYRRTPSESAPEPTIFAEEIKDLKLARAAGRMTHEQFKKNVDVLNRINEAPDKLLELKRARAKGDIPREQFFQLKAKIELIVLPEPTTPDALSDSEGPGGVVEGSEREAEPRAESRRAITHEPAAGAEEFEQLYPEILDVRRAVRIDKLYVTPNEADARYISDRYEKLLQSYGRGEMKKLMEEWNEKLAHDERYLDLPQEEKNKILNREVRLQGLKKIIEFENRLDRAIDGKPEPEGSRMKELGRRVLEKFQTNAVTGYFMRHKWARYTLGATVATGFFFAASASPVSWAGLLMYGGRRFVGSAVGGTVTAGVYRLLEKILPNETWRQTFAEEAEDRKLRQFDFGRFMGATDDKRLELLAEHTTMNRAQINKEIKRIERVQKWKLRGVEATKLATSIFAGWLVGYGVRQVLSGQILQEAGVNKGVGGSSRVADEAARRGGAPRPSISPEGGKAPEPPKGIPLAPEGTKLGHVGPLEETPIGASADELRQAARTAYMEKMSELAAIRKGEGIEHALIRQLDYDAVRFGAPQEVIEKGPKAIHEWAGKMAHKIALDQEYVQTKNGRLLETRVIWDPKNRVQYRLEWNEAAKKPTVVEVNTSGKTYTINELLEKKGGAGVTPAAEIPEQYPIDNALQTGYVPNIAESFDKLSPGEIDTILRSLPDKDLVDYLTIRGNLEQMASHLEANQASLAGNEAAALAASDRMGQIAQTIERLTAEQDQVTKGFATLRGGAVTIATEAVHEKIGDIYQWKLGPFSWSYAADEWEKLRGRPAIGPLEGKYGGSSYGQTAVSLTEYQNRKNLTGYLNMAYRAVGDPYQGETTEGYLTRFEKTAFENKVTFKEATFMRGISADLATQDAAATQVAKTLTAAQQELLRTKAEIGTLQSSYQQAQRQINNLLRLKP